MVAAGERVGRARGPRRLRGVERASSASRGSRASWGKQTPHPEHVSAYGQEVRATLFNDRARVRSQRGILRPTWAQEEAFGYRTSRFSGDGSLRHRPRDLRPRGPERRARRSATPSSTRALGVREGRARLAAKSRDAVPDSAAGAKGMVVDPRDPDSGQRGVVFRGTPRRSPPSSSRRSRRARRGGVLREGESVPRFAAGGGLFKACRRRGSSSARDPGRGDGRGGVGGIMAKHALALVNRGGGTIAGVARSRARDPARGEEELRRGASSRADLPRLRASESVKNPRCSLCRHPEGEASMVPLSLVTLGELLKKRGLSVRHRHPRDAPARRGASPAKGRETSPTSSGGGTCPSRWGRRHSADHRGSAARRRLRRRGGGRPLREPRALLSSVEGGSMLTRSFLTEATDSGLSGTRHVPLPVAPSRRRR